MSPFWVFVCVCARWLGPYPSCGHQLIKSVANGASGLAGPWCWIGPPSTLTSTVHPYWPWQVKKGTGIHSVFYFRTPCTCPFLNRGRPRIFTLHSLPEVMLQVLSLGEGIALSADPRLPHHSVPRWGIEWLDFTGALSQFSLYKQEHLQKSSSLPVRQRTETMSEIPAPGSTLLSTLEAPTPQWSSMGRVIDKIQG